MPPTASHNKFAQWLACSWCQLAIAQLLREQVWIAGIPDGHCRHRLPILWNRKGLPRFLRIKAGHLVHLQAARVRFNGELRGRTAHVMQSHAVRLTLTLRLQM